MKVRLYGKLSAALGPELEVPAALPSTVAGLRRQLAAMNPGIAEALNDNRVRAVVGDSIVADSRRLDPDDEVEFLAPVSGG